MTILAAVLHAAVPARAAAPTSEAFSAYETASGLANLGPRSAEEEQARGVAFLLEAMRRAGLQGVRAVPLAGQPSVVNLEGELPGQLGDEIVLSAHYDTVARSPGAGDDASGCGVVLAAAADLRRTPLRHTIRVVLFDSEEPGLFGSRGWVAARSPEWRARVLAGLNVEMVGWAGSAGPTIHTFPVHSTGGGPSVPAGSEAAGKRVLAPAWLVHFVQRGGEAVGWRFSVADNRFPLLAQLVSRAFDARFAADADSLLERGIPAVTLSDSSLLLLDPAYHRPADVAGRLDAARLDRWVQAVTASVRRLDGLAGRPLAEDRYLAAFGRVWARRDLLWTGFLVWALLVFRGLPGRWRGASIEEHGRQQRRYLPGFVFRLLLLLAIFLAPVFAVLLLPAALLSLFPPRRAVARAAWILLGALPLLAFLAALAFAFAGDLVGGGYQGGWLEAGLVLATLLAYAVLIARHREAEVAAKPG